MKKIYVSFIMATAVIFSVSSQTKITPEKYDFSKQAEGEYKIDKWYKGANTSATANDCENGLFAVAGGPDYTATGDEPTTDFQKTVQKRATIIDLGGEVGKVLCLKGTQSEYSGGAEGTSDEYIPWFNYNFYIPASKTPVSTGENQQPIRTRVVFQLRHNDIEDYNEVTNFVIQAASQTERASVAGILPEDFLKRDELGEIIWDGDGNANFDESKWRVVEFDATCGAENGKPMRLKMNITASSWKQCAILIKEINFYVNPVGEAGETVWEYYDAEVSNINEVVFGKETYTVAGNQVSFTEAGQIYAISGILVADAQAGETVTLEKGVYVVKAGNKTSKIAIR